ncbi:TsaE protein [Mucinivorans hirudinis]|uniref:tRNA threonylcarbamoyladenosine biosynthesis protein TsaE n=1 Tax=Mucinivorans hirudinis TaxID=1433126 RepID=A0A060R7U9_9BACT|nr:TsaE protein [Mucinivorans hirudinis]
MEAITIKSLSALEEAVEKLIKHIKEHKVVAFYGEMGAGKTTLISEICHQLGVGERVCSPSFAIVNVYNSDEKRPIYHFDFYRIKKLEEVYDFGYHDYFYSNDLCLVEWPEMVEELLPEHTLRLGIEVVDEYTRIVKMR